MIALLIIYIIIFHRLKCKVEVHRNDKIEIDEIKKINIKK